MFNLKTAIPTESPSKGVLYLQGILYFASGTFLYKYNMNKYSIIASVDSFIIDFNIVNEKAYVITGDRMYIFYNNNMIASMSRESTSINVSNDFIFLGTKNILEVWDVPREYKFNMFDLRFKALGHYGSIRNTLLYSDTKVLTCSDDCTVRIYDLETNESKKVYGVRSTPLKTHIIDEVRKDFVIVCEGGQIIYMNENLESYHKLFLDKKITDSCSSGDMIALCTEKDNGSALEIIKEFKVVYSVEIEQRINEIDIENNLVVIKNEKYIGIYNIETDMFTYELCLPKITCMASEKELLLTGCSDKNIRLYKNSECIKTFTDEKMTYPIFNVHFLKNSVLSVLINGQISIFDIKNLTCYRTFIIPCKLSATEVCDEGSLLFIAEYETYTVKVIDLQRSKEIDQLEGNIAPIKYMKYVSGKLFTLSMDNELKKWNIYKSTFESFNFEKMITSILIKNNRIFAADVKSITIYDFEFNYIKSITYEIKSRKRNELFNSNKPVQYMDASPDNRFLVFGGEANTVKVIDIPTSEVVSIIPVSKNRNLENFKEKLTKEKNSKFNKDNVIELIGISYHDHKNQFNLLSREGIFVYSNENERVFSFDIDVKTTPSAVKEYISNKEYLNAIVSSLRIGDKDLIVYTILEVPITDIDNVVKYIPKQLADKLRNSVFWLIENGYKSIDMLKWFKSVLFFHAGEKDTNEYNSLVNISNETYKLSKSNFYMLKNILNRKHSKGEND